MVSVGLLKEQTRDPLLAKLVESLDSSTQRGAKLVKQILTFGRGVKGERLPVNLRDLAREIQSLVKETFPVNVQLEVRAPASLWPVIGDPTQLHQVLLNLAINARDAMPTGGQLTITFENTLVDETNAAFNAGIQSGSYVRIQVADTGTGMTPEIIERIFEPFFTTKPTGQGTGLGLATTMGIIKSHGGFINVYSEPGKGSTFKVYLPARAEGETAAAESESAETLPRGHGEIILLVDDEEAILTTVKKILERYGYRVLTAVNGAEAVSLYAARGAEIAVVITDMHMPIMDGPATIVALQSINPHVRIIGSSGLAANGSVAKAASFGVRLFVPKPYSAEKILRTLRDALNNGHEGLEPK
jgi:CheY-like chemotaxis protein